MQRRLPTSFEGTPTGDVLLGHLPPISKGKVRSKWMLADHPGHMLVVTSDDISVFDFVLGITIPDKGMILNMLNIWWRDYTGVTGTIPSDIVAYGADIDRFLPRKLRKNVWLQSRAVVVRILDMFEFEFIVREYLTGSGFREYEATGMLCGHELPTGLIDGSKLPRTLFTPSTKAQEGHDINIDFRLVMSKHPEAAMASVEITQRASQVLLEKANIIFVDTKQEYGELNGVLYLGDELGTPDSSRFWDADAYAAAHAQGKLPPSKDKEFVRDAARKLSINKLDPKLSEHRVIAYNTEFPPETIERTAGIYRQTFTDITGFTPEDFAREIGIAV